MGTEKPQKNTGRLLQDLQSQGLLGASGDATSLFDIFAEIFKLFGMDWTNSMRGVTESHIVASPVFQNGLKSKGIDYEQYRKNYFENLKQEDVDKFAVKGGVFDDDTTADIAFRAAVNIGIERHAEELERRGTRYGFGDKNSAHGSIDCSGFVGETLRSAMNSILPEDAKSLTGRFATHSDGQISNLARKTGAMLMGKDVVAENIKACTVIGIDSGDKKWDRGRNLGVDHVGIVYVDSKTGVKMFAESNGKDGVITTPLEEKLDYYKGKGWKLYAADFVESATAEQKLEVAQKIKQNSELDKDTTVAQNDVKPDEANPAADTTVATVAPVV